MFRFNPVSATVTRFVVPDPPFFPYGYRYISSLSTDSHDVSWLVSTSKPAARLIIKYEDDNPLHVETQKNFDMVCNRDTDAFCQGIN